MMKPIVVAIDGPAGAGKSTIARRVAAKLGYLYIDTGAMYRAVALWALRNGVDFVNAASLEQLAIAAQIEFREASTRVLLNGEDITEAIRTPELSDASSRVSTVASVRRALVAKQRQMALSSSVVMEGRDIGSVVFPDAQVKIFLDADSSERASRRLLEMAQKGQSAPAAEIARQIEERDQRDRTRAEAPLLQAPDATYLDSTGLTIDEVEEAVLEIVRARTSNGTPHS
jgi:CMP/dCMP kinase